MTGMTPFAALAVFAAKANGPLLSAWLAVPPGHYDPASGHSPSWGKATPAGLLIWLFLGLALFFLIKSMNRHIRRVKSQGDSFGSVESGEVDGGDMGGAGEPGEGDGDSDVDATVGSAHGDSAAGHTAAGHTAAGHTAAGHTAAGGAVTGHTAARGAVTGESGDEYDADRP